MLSIKFIHAIKLNHETNWRLARRCDLHPSTLSRWLNGAETPRPDDPRLKALADAVGMTAAECVNQTGGGAA